MTPVSSSPVALLDQLDELRAKATPGPWQHDDYVPGAVYGAPGDLSPIIADCRLSGDADAALIVAAVNAVGPLAAAVRAVLELADQWDADHPVGIIRREVVDQLRAALSVTP